MSMPLNLKPGGPYRMFSSNIIHHHRFHLETGRYCYREVQIWPLVPTAFSGSPSSLRWKIHFRRWISKHGLLFPLDTLRMRLDKISNWKLHKCQEKQRLRSQPFQDELFCWSWLLRQVALYSLSQIFSPSLNIFLALAISICHQAGKLSSCQLDVPYLPSLDSL